MAHVQSLTGSCQQAHASRVLSFMETILESCGHRRLLQDEMTLQAAEMEQEFGNSGALSGNKAAGIMEMLTQKLLALDNIDTQGDQCLRQERKAVINRINKLLDHLEAMKKR